MKRFACLLLLALPAVHGQEEAVFRTGVTLVRVDAQVLDRNNRAVTGLRVEDFVLREEGKEQPIRSFSREEMPIDVLFLIDVSGSMRTHVERLARAASTAMQVLGKDDRVGIMVFDRNTRVRMGLRTGVSEVNRELDRLLHQETFSGGTDITRAFHDAAKYMQRSGRKDARRAIIILTDDETEAQFDVDEQGVLDALERADCVLSALLAPNAMDQRGMGQQMPFPRGGGGGRRGGGFPGGGGGGWPPIIIGPQGGGRSRTGGGGPTMQGGSRTRSAGTAAIARESGGDSAPVDRASALDETLQRIRQRYALFFAAPAGAREGEQRRIEVALSGSGRQRYSDADVRYRRTYVSPGGGGGNTDDAEVISGSGRRSSRPASASDDDAPVLRRRPAVSEGGVSAPPVTSSDEPAARPGWRRAGSTDAPTTIEATPPETPKRRPAVNERTTGSGPSGADAAPPAPKPGWRRVEDPAPPTAPVKPPN